MATSKTYLTFILEQLPPVTYRGMMGEYVLYYQDKVIGGLYDDRFLVKDVPAARALLPDAPLELPYEGAKPMLLVENLEDQAFLQRLLAEMWPQLPSTKKRK